jgi:hypothetical protein
MELVYTILQCDRTEYPSSLLRVVRIGQDISIQLVHFLLSWFCPPCPVCGRDKASPSVRVPLFLGPSTHTYPYPCIDVSFYHLPSLPSRPTSRNRQLCNTNSHSIEPRRRAHKALPHLELTIITRRINQDIASRQARHTTTTTTHTAKVVSLRPAQLNGTRGIHEAQHDVRAALFVRVHQLATRAAQEPRQQQRLPVLSALPPRSVVDKERVAKRALEPARRRALRAPPLPAARWGAGCRRRGRRTGALSDTEQDDEEEDGGGGAKPYAASASSMVKGAGART